MDYFGARYYASNQGRFTSADEIWKDSHVADPQSWNKYAYVRNNSLALVDPSGEKAEIIVETDPEKKTGTIKISASFAVIVTKGSGITAEQAQAVANKVKAQIEAKWKGVYKQDGYTFTVSTEATVQVMDESRAVTEGQAGRIDNVVMLTAGDRGRMLETGEEFGAWSYRLPGEKFDRVMVPVDVNQDDVYAHEFTHLLGNPDLRGHILSNTKPEMRAGLSTATPEDFSVTFRQLVKAHVNAGKSVSTIVRSDVAMHATVGNRRYTATIFRSSSIQLDPF